MSEAGAAGIEVVPFADAHWPSLQGFLRRAFGEDDLRHSRDYFDWRHQNGPWGSALDAYLLLLHRNEVVGQLGAMRDRLVVDGVSTPVVWVVDLHVDEEWRNQMGSLRLLRKLMATEPVLLVSGAGPQVEKLYSSLRFKKVRCHQTLFAPLRPSALLRAANRLDGVAALAARPADLLLPTVQRLAARSRDDAGLSVFRVWPNEPEVAAFLERASSSHRAIAPQRSASVYSWKLGVRPEAQVEVWGARATGGPLLGVALVKWLRRPGAFEALELVDLVTNGDSRVERAFVRRAIADASASTVDFVRVRSATMQPTRVPPVWLDGTRNSVDDIYVWSKDPAFSERFVRGPFDLTSLVADRVDYGKDERLTMER